MTEFNLPDVSPTIAEAIHQASSYCLAQHEQVLGVIAAGSLIRGDGDRHSDVDTFVLINGTYRQRMQKFFNGIRFELFVNAIDFVPLYFEQERRDGGPSTAHMLATGHIVLKRDPIIDDIIDRAKTFLANGPEYIADDLLSERYMLADRLENGFDLRYRDPVMGHILLDSALYGILEYYFKIRGRWIPRHKDMMTELRQDAPALATQIEHYYRVSGNQKFDIAGQIADLVLGTRGFFEWDSKRDYLD